MSEEKLSHALTNTRSNIHTDVHTLPQRITVVERIILIKDFSKIQLVVYYQSAFSLAEVLLGYIML